MNNILTYKLYEANKIVNKDLFKVFGKSLRYLYNNDVIYLTDNNITKINLDKFFNDVISRLSNNLLIIKNSIFDFKNLIYIIRRNQL